MMKDVMVDLETLGTDPGAAILSIGAVKFGPDGLGDEFYKSVDLESCDRAGLDIDAGTLSWWMEQDDDAKEVLTGGEDLKSALYAFSTFYGDAERIWANSPSFDCEILGEAYGAVDLVVPWSFRDERCFRTLRSLPGAVWVDREGTHHNALDDAKHQAKKTYQTLNEYQRFAEDDGNETGIQY